jgi:uncharacterized protein (TIGR00730 family)
MARSTRLFLPQPAAAPHETSAQRVRRKARTKLGQLVDRLILSLYRTISWLERQAPAERRYFRVAIFGSSRIQPADAAYARVRELARRLSFMGCDIVTGGGPGLMQAANEGARDGAYRYRTRSFGLTILLPMEEQPNPFLDEVAHHPTFFSRLHQFVRLSHVSLVLDGGIGTTLEAMMVWQLLQVRLLADRPLIFVGPMWRGLRSWVDEEIVQRGLASPGDLEVVHWVDDIEQALALVETARNDFLRRHEVRLPPPVLVAAGAHVADGEEPPPARDEPAEA